MGAGYERLPREYRLKRSRMRLFLWVIALGTVSVALTLLSADDLPTSFTYPFLVAWVALMGWLFYATLRCSTTADLKAIHVRAMVRRRRLAWEDIQGIRAELNPGAALQQNAPGVLVYAFGRDGKKVLLPFLDDLHVNVEREVTVLLEAWEELRGEDWAPLPEAVARIDRHNARQAAILTAFTTTMLVFIPLVVLMLLPLFVDMPGWLESVLHPFVTMGVGMPLVFVLTAVFSYRRRMRDG
ncbi:PH domain-containing protein [Streptomyces sp. NPDC002599]|uniref:PH domain-containing protein n=1 Tax=Streptomyces sp. NPDC002599 TaxID=3154421 RepID=UPI00332E03FE